MKHTHNKYFFIITLLYLFLIPSESVIAQQDNFFNPILFNGRIYSYNPYNISSGNPFLMDDTFQEGRIFLQGKEYKTLLNFDIVDHKVIIYYPYFTTVSMISIPKELVDSFYFDNRIFVRKEVEGKVVFFEKIGRGNRYFLFKNIKIESVNSSPNELIYSSTIRTIFLWNGDSLIKIRNKRNLLKNFSKVNQQKIKAYWRKNHFKYRKANRNQWQLFVAYLNTKIS